METFPLWQLSRLRMGTDGHGVTDLVCSFGCPLNCKYCINPLSHCENGKYTNVTPEQLVNMVKLDSLYFEATGGGIMFGGGEPLLHAKFIAKFREIEAKSWRNYCETSLYVSSECVKVASTCIDGFYVDIKDTNPEIFKKYTGVDGIDKVVDNLTLLLSLVGPDKITVRVPRIPEYNAENNIQDSLQKLKSIGITNFDVFNYRIKRSKE